ncbi:MAG: ABC transporter ATP-binding protein [Actinobacteria bacterium]|nr:ABC transporter ATP-binding protein [Actinomycetota bacterium]
MTSLEIRDLTVQLGSREVLKNLDLYISSGLFAAILGPSGCGKTTLLRSIAGLITPKGGAIRFGKQLVSISSLVLPPHKRNVGYVPQEGGLFPHLSVEENVSFALGRRVSRKEKQEIVEQLLDLVGMPNYQKKLPQELSGGQQTRIALARALAMKPAMILLDEPFAALDQTLRAEISQEVVALLKSSKTTSIMVTHDREDALVSADIIALMRDGQVVQSGSPSEVYLRPISAAAAESTGDILTLPARRIGRNKYLSPLNSPVEQIGKQVGFESGQILVRPEEIVLMDEPDENLVSAKICKINYYGHDALVELDFTGLSQTIRARVTDTKGLVVGSRVFVSHKGPFRWMPEKATGE